MTFKPIFVKSLFIVVPYFVGLALSSTIIPVSSSSSETTPNLETEASPFHALPFAIHRNGEPEPCGSTISDLQTTLISLLFNEDVIKQDINNVSSLRNLDLTKHEVDSILTASFGKHLLSQSSCGPEKVPKSIKGYKRHTWGRGLNYKIDGVDSSFLNFCDMGEERTPILHDHNELVPVISGGDSDFNDESGKGIETLPCHFHTREGYRVTSLDQLIDLATAANMEVEGCNEDSDDEQKTCQMSKMMHLYAVPAGRLFMFAPSYVGEVFEIPHVSHPSNNDPVILRVLSVSPRVFDMVNFFAEEESAAIVSKALRETSETHRIKRSSTGASGYNVNSQRTSENGFDTHGTTAVAVKERSLSLLGFDEYVESYTDGLQVLRYNKTTAYIPHMDWIDDPGKKNVHDFDSAKLGTNRFATVLLYMTNLGENDGGETVFKKGWPVGLPAEERRQRQDVLQELRKTGEVDFLKEGSWEENMVADCRSRLAVKPHAGRAVLFYSQHPNGEEDTSSLHGGCPVLQGEKWAANNWVWNGPRGGFPGSPINKEFRGTPEEANPGQLSGKFINTGRDPAFKNAILYFQETEWADFSHGETLSVNTYAGHEWNVKDPKGNLLKQWLVQDKPKSQVFKV
jgi:hypothetical protein